jgi:hypothetical protein
MLKCNTLLSVPNTRLLVYRAHVMSVLLLGIEFCRLVICNPFVPREYKCARQSFFFLSRLNIYAFDLCNVRLRLQLFLVLMSIIYGRGGGENR